MRNLKYLHMVACVLVWAGGLNWGLVGLLNLNLVESLLGMSVAKLVYILIGLATVYVIVTHKSDCKTCSA